MSREKIIETEIIEVEPSPLWKDAEEMEELCCTPSKSIPCKKVVEPWKGYDVEDILEDLGIELDEHGRNANGDVVEILLVRPKGGQCGQKETIYEPKAKNCCEEVTELNWDDEFSVEVLAADSAGAVGVVGGKGPYAWTLQGVDVRFGNGKKTITTDNNYVWVYSGPDFCGYAAILVTDTCDQEAGGDIRSVEGQWVLHDSGAESPCYITGSNDLCGGSYDYYDHYGLVSGRYKLTETRYTQYASVIGLENVSVYCNAYGFCDHPAPVSCFLPFWAGCDGYYCDNCRYLTDGYKYWIRHVHLESRETWRWECG